MTAVRRLFSFAVEMCIRDSRYSDPLTAADNAMTFQTVVKTIARRNGLFADFTPKPLKDHPGNGFHINVSVNASDKEDHMDQILSLIHI